MHVLLVVKIAPDTGALIPIGTNNIAITAIHAISLIVSLL